MKLVIGNKNYSSWSLRPWLLPIHNIEFSEVCIARQVGIKDRLRKYSDSCKVPALTDKNLTIWDSLQYVNIFLRYIWVMAGLYARPKSYRSVNLFRDALWV